MKKLIYLFTITLVGFTSCNSNVSENEKIELSNSNTKKHTIKICDCLQDIGLDDITLSKMDDYSYMRKFEKKAEKKMPPCLLEVMKEIKLDMEEMSKPDKIAYTKAFLKNCIDSECSDVMLKLIPYDMIDMAIEEFEKEIGRKNQY